MQDLSFAALINVLSAPRLGAYRQRPDEEPQVVIGRYKWNIRLCQALYPALGHLEIALRNSLHNALTSYCKSTGWYMCQPSVLGQRETATVRAAQGELARRDKQAHPDAVVAELSFAFWTSLLSRDYEGTLWPALLKAVFPNMPRRDRTRRTAAATLQPIRRLRNRAAHYEPIWKWPGLLLQYRQILQVLSWFEPGLVLLAEGDAFEQLFNGGSQLCEVTLVP